MITALVALVINLAILYIVYLVLQWIIGFFAIVPPVLLKVLNIIFAVLAFIVVLNFLGALLGSGGLPFAGYKLK